MSVLLDTNILCRLAEPAHPTYAIAERAVENLKRDGEALVVVPQVMYEYWVVVTRPRANNGLGMTPDQADFGVDRCLSFCTLLSDERGIFRRWRELVRRYGVHGKSGHDARLVAAMLRHRLNRLLTFNADDFRRYSEVSVLTPERVR